MDSRNLYWYEWLIIALYSLYAILITLYMRNLIENKLAFFKIKIDPKKLDSKWNPFIRSDRSKWSACEIYFCAIFILPIRVFILFLMAIVSITFSVCCACVPRKDQTHIEQSSCRRFLYKLFVRSVIRVCMFAMGVYWIPHHNRKISDYDKSYPSENYKKKDQNPYIIVGNHIGYLESMYFAVSKYCPSFVAKNEIAKLPILGTFGKILQCIFVDRSNDDTKNQVLADILKRCKNLKEGKKFAPLAMFPEGTCTNGKYLISFKRGAFEPLQPIKMFVFKFNDRKFSHHLDSISLGSHFLITLCQLINSFEVNEFDTYYPDHLDLEIENQQHWKIYADKIKNIMCSVTGLINCESGFRDCRAYEKLSRQYKQELVLKKQISSQQQLHRNFSQSLTIAGIKRASQEDLEASTQDKKTDLVIPEKSQTNEESYAQNTNDNNNIKENNINNNKIIKNHIVHKNSEEISLRKLSQENTELQNQNQQQEKQKQDKIFNEFMNLQQLEMQNQNILNNEQNSYNDMNKNIENQSCEDSARQEPKIQQIVLATHHSNIKNSTPTN